MVHRPYQLNATCFFSGTIPTIEIHSNRKHRNIPTLLARHGLQVKNCQWFEFSSLVMDSMMRPHGTGPAAVPTKYYAIFEVTMAPYCPLGEPDLCAKFCYRVIDRIASRWLP